MRRAASVALILAGFLMLGAGPASSLHHSITISLFPPDNSLLATDSIRVDAGDIEGSELKFLINGSLMVENVSSDVNLWS